MTEQVAENRIDDRIDECEYSADELFARDVFKRAQEKQNYLIETNSNVDFTSDENFLTFWTENGQYLCWYQFVNLCPEYPTDIFDKISILSQIEIENLNKKWSEISDQVFAYAQLYWAAIH